MVAKGINHLQLEARLYDTSSEQIDFSTLPINMIGRGCSEKGDAYGVNANLSGTSQTATGTWIKAGSTDFKAFSFGAPATTGAFLDRFGFVQSHPDVAPGWSPNLYDYLIDNENAAGGITLGDQLMFLNINKGIFNLNSGRLHLKFLKGQFFSQALYVDQAYDITYLDRMHLWDFGCGDPNVMAFQQAHLIAVWLGRVDGFHAGDLFSLGGNTTVALENLSNSGPATDVDIKKLFSDASRVALYNDVANCGWNIGYLKSQGQNIPAADGSALPNSYGVQQTANAGGSVGSIGRRQSERYSGAGISTPASAPVFVSGAQRDILNTGPIFQTTGGSGPAIQSAFFPVNDGSAGGTGAYGIDYTLLDDDRVYNFTGTTNASGSANFAHNLGTDAVYSLRDTFAHVKGNSGESIPMTYAGCDGSNLNFTSSAAYGARPFRASIRLSRTVQGAW